MKKYILSIILVFAGIVSEAQGIRFSFMANPQLTWFSGTDENYQANGSFPGINIGLELDAFFTENYAFSTGISLNNIRGGAIYDDILVYRLGETDKILEPGSRMTYGLQYITVPLGLKFKTIEIGYSTYWLNTGLSPMFLIRSRVSDETDTFSKTDFIDETRFYNMNYFIEGGIEYSLGGNTAFIAGIGYHSGFFDVTKNSSYRLTTQGFSLILGILF
ncbi:MAG: porin family protein [Bacteroidota bacterium]